MMISEFSSEQLTLSTALVSVRFIKEERIQLK